MKQVVIALPDEVYEKVKDGMLGDLETMFICGSVAQGKVLPKGHGDLIDRSKLDTRERGNNSQRCMWWNIKQIIENAPIVIEADKGE